MKFKKIRDVCVFKNNLRGKKFQEIRNLNDNFGNMMKQQTINLKICLFSKINI